MTATKEIMDLMDKIETNELYIKAVEYETKNRRNKLLKECVAVLDSVTE